MNLIRCMPADLWETVDVDVSTRALNTWRLTRALVASDWDRLLKYSPRITSLTEVEHPYDPQFPYLPTVLDTLRRGVPGDYLLPGLEHIDWNLTGEALSCIDVFLGPHISSINIKNCTSDTLLATLAAKYPTLTAVDLHSVDPVEVDSTQLYDARSNFVRTLTDVHSVKMDTIDLSAFTHLGQISTLETLHIAIPASISFAGVPEQTLFPSLRTAEINAQRNDVQELIAFLRTWNDTPVESFSAFLDAYLSEKHIEDLYRVLADRCVNDCLQALKLELLKANPSITYPASSTHPPSALRHLFPFENLISVSIHVLNGFDLDDTLITDLSLAWPYIEDLELRTDAQPHPPRATLLALLALSENCPDLTKLEIALDATDIPPPHIAPEPRHVAQENLVSLAIGQSRIDSAFGVARFLSSIFSAVQVVTPADPYVYMEVIDDEAVEMGVLREEEWRHGVNFARGVMAKSAQAAEGEEADEDEDGDDDEGEGMDE
ncbi:hypothetical protein MVEN_01884900 [Mycena venus]|uniref:Uncharacterized protein n=1 Tax=Mycena venus TaxID=2733690 RepID=A0A8H6XJ64_9AGAR|nr:hypothetical protein MVEN_01884900 [Mycena venus]